MALQLKINICSKNCNSLIFKELTGIYNSTTNSGGWGNPNDIIANAFSANLVITTPDNVDHIINLFNNFPTDSTTKEFLINNTDLGYSDKIPDGKYTINYNVDTLLGSYNTQLTYYNICNVSCCVESMISKIDDITCSCSKDDLNNYLEAYSILLGLKHNIMCGKSEDFDEILKFLNTLCINNKCKNC